jgi:YebC/PmpR family DNA-binding regulatory protein
MSGHSHYATIKRQKESKDAQRGQAFSKLAKEISIAAKVGGGGDIDSNYKLRVAVERARAANMPKENIERAISKAVGSGGGLEEITYEGFGPFGISVIVETATDNKNRTSQEIKNLFERGGGSPAGPGSVSYNFDTFGMIAVDKNENSEDQVMRLIELGAEDIEETGDALEVYVAPTNLAQVRKSIEENGFTVTSFEIMKRPKNLQTIDNLQDAQKALKFLDNISENPDVQKVYANLDVPEDIIKEIK